MLAHTLSRESGALDARVTSLEVWRLKIDRTRQLELWPRDYMKIGAAIAIVAAAVKARYGFDLMTWLGLSKSGG